MTRIKVISIFLLAVFIALTIRLAYIQLVGHEELSAATRAQSLIALEGSNTRGIIYDRNGEALVADEKQYIYIIKDSDFTEEAEELLQQVGAAIVSDENTGYRVYSSKKYEKATGKKLIKNNNAYILQASARYGEDQIAAHYIGYVNKGDLSGASGLELMYDEQLSGLNRRVYAAADVKGNILTGRGLIIASEAGKDSYVAEGIRTTIDKALQKAVEDIIGEMGNDCAVVVLESKTGGVAAMACTPGFDPDNVDELINNETVSADGKNDEGHEDALINKVTQGQYPPGSVFKIVTAAAAMEDGVDIDKTYYCSGHAVLDGLTIKCDTGGYAGHGNIGFEEAMARSCNSYFIQLGRDIGADKIIAMAEKMGLGQEVLDGYPHEATGHLMTEEERAGNAIGNLSIGQGEILVTPIQVAAMTNILANDGVDIGTHILMGEKQEQDQVISADTAAAIRNMMESASVYGTGAALGLVEDSSASEHGSKAIAALKTGTAEYTAADGMRSHGWITAITPCDEPEYTITVFVEDGGSGSLSAGSVLKKIIEYLQDSGSYSMPTFA